MRPFDLRIAICYNIIRKDKGDNMKAILMPLKGEAARNFEKFVSSNEKPKTRKTSKAKRAKIIAFINSVDKNESDNK